MKKLVLASSSPRRRELIQSLGLNVELLKNDVDETITSNLTPPEIVETLSLRKARTARKRLHEHEEAVVVGSDTIVVIDGEALGKPANDDEARRMLTLLSGRNHHVFTGIACIDHMSGREQVSHRKTTITMKRLTEAQINRYIATGEPSDKAGAYGIQGIGATLVDTIEGDYFNVVGLSVSLLTDMLHDFDIHIL